MGNFVDPPDTGHPAFDFWATAIAVALGLAAVLIFVLVIPAYRQLTEIKYEAKRAARDAAEARNQTENSHAKSANPNLRDDLDAKHTETHQWLEHLAKMLARVERGQARTDKEIARINDSMLSDRNEIRRLHLKIDSYSVESENQHRRIVEVESKLDEHRDVTEP